MEKARGDVDAALAAAAVTVTLAVTTPAALHSPMEPHGAVAEWHGDQLTVHEGTQGIFRVRDNLAKAFRLPLAQVRVVSEHMGGGFGAKNYAGTHTYLAALFARRLGAPVACILDRHGEQTDTGHRAATEQTVTLGADADGRLVAIAMDTVVATGVGGWAAAPGAIAHVLYACPNVRTRDTFAFTNVGAMDSFRAPGYVEGAFGLERAMDVLARRLGLDPLELRRRNFAAHDPSQDRPWSGNALLRCYDEAAERFGWAARRAELAAARARAPHAAVKRGVGCAAEVWATGGGPPAYAHVRLNPDGSADVLVGTQDLGTGVRTLCAQVAAEALGYPLSRVHVTVGDTAAAPYTGNSWGSMTTPSVMPAVRMAAEDARRQLCEAAAELLGDAAADTLVVRDAAVHDATGARRITAAEIGAKLGQVTIVGRGARGPNPERTGIASFGVQLVEVAVDAETGVVRVERIVAAHDAGRVVNPLLARSQLEGGILQGLGYALFEERVVDRALGIPLNTGLHDYKVPVMADTPAIDAWCVGGADTAANHVGARGLAEAPIIPIAPAIANAVADALGVEPDALPLTPWRVLGWLGTDA
jgi:xanthine dehydrogenase YagR molybdenum-binding subunit